MSFWDNVKKFAQPYSDADYDDYEDEEEQFEEPEPAPTSRSRRTSPFAAASAPAQEPETPPAAAAGGYTGPVLNMNGSGSGKQEVVLFHAKAFDDSAKAATELRKKKAVILNMENVDKTLTRRVVDFLSGSVYALDGSVKKVAQSTYLFCPHNMDVVGDLEGMPVESDNLV